MTVTDRTIRRRRRTGVPPDAPPGTWARRVAHTSRIVAHLAEHGPQTAAQIREALGWPHRTGDRRIEAAWRDGQIVVVSEERRVRWRLVLA